MGGAVSEGGAVASGAGAGASGTGGAGETSGGTSGESGGPATGGQPGGNGRRGHADLTGSLFERVFDFTAGAADDFYSTTVDGCSDCVNLGDAYLHPLRGGAHNCTAHYLRAAQRNYGGPGRHNDRVGLRCAR